MFRTMAFSFAALALAACQGQDETDAPAATPEQTGDAAGAPAPNEAPSPQASADGEAPNPAGFSSHYQPLDLTACTVTDSEVEEGEWAERTCPGYRGIPLFVDDGDGRFDIDAGVRNDLFQSLFAFNNPPEKIEWRMRDGTPFAVIYRLTDASPEEVGRTVLMVERIGTANRPGCTIAQVAGNTPNANARARAFADQSAADFDCADGELQTVGNAR